METSPGGVGGEEQDGAVAVGGKESSAGKKEDRKETKEEEEEEEGILSIAAFISGEEEQAGAEEYCWVSTALAAAVAAAAAAAVGDDGDTPLLVLADFSPGFCLLCGCRPVGDPGNLMLFTPSESTLAILPARFRLFQDAFRGRGSYSTHSMFISTQRRQGRVQVQLTFLL